MADVNKEEFEKFISEHKGKRKFKQSVELAINFKAIDFSKQDNRLNFDVNLPNGKGKTKKIAVFASDKELIGKAEKSDVTVFHSDELDAIGKDNKRLLSLLNYDLYAQPNLMPNIAKSMGQFLGPRNNMPKPLIGVVNFDDIISQSSKKITLKNRGKYLPTIHCTVGTEDMDVNKLYDNVNEVVGSIVKKVGNNKIRSIYLKLSMSEPMKIM